MADGNYKLQSEWTSASTVEMADGNTAETNLGAIQGITDSLTATSSNIALSAKAGNNLQGQIDTVNSNLDDLIEQITVENVNITIGFLVKPKLLISIVIALLLNAFITPAFPS